MTNGQNTQSPPASASAAKTASRELASLYVIHAVNCLLPIVTTPYLSRTLGPNNWGLLAFFQIFAQILIIVIEFSFGFSATRHLARTRDSVKDRTETLRDVFTAKLMLTGLICAVTAVATLLVPLFRQNLVLLISGLCWAFAGGMNLTWYFQGVGRIKLQAIIETATRALGTVLIFGLVRTPNDSAKTLVLYAVTALLSVVIGIVIVRRDTSLLRPSLTGGLSALRNGFALFLYRAAATVCTLSNGVILGFFVTPAQIGYYAGAEKIARGTLSLLHPLMQFLYASLNHRMATKPSDAKQLFRIGAVALGLTGTLSGLALFFGAPLFVRLLLGPNFAESVGLLRILALLVPLVAATTIFGVQWMIPLGLDRQFTAITIGAGAFNLVLAFILAPMFQQQGVCWAIIASELVAAVSCIAYLEVKRKNPFRREAKEHSAEEQECLMQEAAS